MSPLSRVPQFLPTHCISISPIPPQSMWPAGAGPTTLAAFRKQQTLMEHRKEGGERREQGQALTTIIPEATPSPHFTALWQEGRISVASCPACLQCNGHPEPHEVRSVTKLGRWNSRG